MKAHEKEAEYHVYHEAAPGRSVDAPYYWDYERATAAPAAPQMKRHIVPGKQEKPSKKE